MDNFSVGGGVNSFVYDLCHALQREGCEVILIGLLKKGYEGNQEVKQLKENGIRVICLGARNKKDALCNYVGKLRKEIRSIASNESTICNLHLKLSVMMGGIATVGFKNIVCVETYHSQYSHYNLEYFLMKNRIRFYIPCSGVAGKEMKKRFKVPDNKMKVIPNGIDCCAIRKVEAKKNEGTTILSVGRLTRQKNYPVAIEAFNEICSENLHYDIVGEGEAEKELKAMAINKNIRFLGAIPRENVLSLTAGADIICMPSLWEGLSIYMMEAFALGKPMMLSDIPSFREALGETELEYEDFRICPWGYLVKNSPEAYRLAMKDFITSNRKKDMQKASYKIAEKFDIDNTAKKYTEVYRAVLIER